MHPTPVHICHTQTRFSHGEKTIEIRGARLRWPGKRRGNSIDERENAGGLFIVYSVLAALIPSFWFLADVMSSDQGVPGLTFSSQSRNPMLDYRRHAASTDLTSPHLTSLAHLCLVQLPRSLAPQPNLPTSEYLTVHNSSDRKGRPTPVASALFPECCGTGGCSLHMSEGSPPDKLPSSTSSLLQYCELAITMFSMPCAVC